MYGRSLIMAALIVLSGILVSCDKEFKLELPLAVNDLSIGLGTAEGTTHVLVYSTGKWTATLADPADASWATIDEGWGSGNSDFVFSYTENFGLQRKCDIVITTDRGDTKTITMTQKGAVQSATLIIGKQALLVPCGENIVNLPFTTNLGNALETIASFALYAEGTQAVGEEELLFAPANGAGWVSDITVTDSQLSFTTAPNDTQADRCAKVTLKVLDNVTGTTYEASVYVNQSTQAGYFAVPNTVEVEPLGKPVTIPWETNMENYFDDTQVTVEYAEESSTGWLQDIQLTPQAITANVAESKYDGERHANVTIAYTGVAGTVTASFLVIQAKPELEVPFADLRAMLTSAGKTTLEKGFIMAHVISEPNNPNMETNPHTDWKTVNYTDQYKTAYIQSIDGRYGFRVKLADEADAEKLPRYALLKIALGGLELEREDTPARYTLNNFKADNILETTAGTASDLAYKNIHIQDLVDDDIYTFVTFLDMELAFRYGAWGNQHEGFSLKSDIVPGGTAGATRSDAMARFFRDINGDVLPMIINSQVPWRRFGSYVPKGSGTVSAIVVHSPLGRYNLNKEMGTYQFRVVAPDDIKLGSTSAFSNIIAEWQWTGGSSTIKFAEGFDKKLGVIDANLGTGRMMTSATNIDAAGPTGLTTSFLQKSFSVTATEYYSFRYNAKWWNFTTDEGENISWTFSTKGITGANKHLSFSMVGSIGKQAQPNTGAPAQWNFEYSTDGVNFTVLKKNFYFYPSPVFAYTKMNCPAGNAEYIFNLPDELLDKDQVVVRMKATSKKNMTSAGVTSGTITESAAATYLRFESIVIRVNK